MAFDEEVARLRKLTEIERPVEEKDGWKFGARIRVLEDDEENGVYEDSEGYLILEEVGAPEYNNVRISAAILEDGMDSTSDVDLDNIEAVA